MLKIQKNKGFAIFAIAATAFLTQACSSAPAPTNKADVLPTAKPTAVPTVAPTGNTMTQAPAAQVTKPPKDTANTGTDTSAGKDSAQSKSICGPVGDNVIQATQMASENTGEAYVDSFLSFTLLEDNSATVQVPQNGDRVIVIKCATVAHLSSGFKGGLDIYELLDSDGNYRVRYDNFKQITN